DQEAVGALDVRRKPDAHGAAKELVDTVSCSDAGMIVDELGCAALVDRPHGARHFRDIGARAGRVTLLPGAVAANDELSRLSRHGQFLCVARSRCKILRQASKKLPKARWPRNQWRGRRRRALSTRIAAAFVNDCVAPRVARMERPRLRSLRELRTGLS